MKSYLFSRMLLLVPLLLGITIITFSLTKALPGDPVFSLVGERSSPEIIEKIRKEIGADKDIFTQYAGYLSLLSQGELGRSYYTNRKVSDDIRSKLPHTFVLASMAMLIAVPVGVLMGLGSALASRPFIDRALSLFAIVGLSLPVFWSGLMLMLFASLKLHLLPPSGTGGLRYLLLPALTLSIPALATFARVTRVSVLENRAMPYIRTAFAKGLPDAKVIVFHILRNALIPVVTVVGLDFGSYLSGAVLTETIFGWDGIGRFAMEAIIKRDYPVIMGCILVSTVTFVFINLVVDLTYHYLDPRLRIDGKNS